MYSTKLQNVKNVLNEKFHCFVLLLDKLYSCSWIKIAMMNEPIIIRCLNNALANPKTPPDGPGPLPVIVF